MLKKKGNRPRATITRRKADRGGESMEIGMKSFETTGTIDSRHNLILDEPLPIAGRKKVRVLILMNTEDDIDEDDWLRAASRNPAFTFLDDPEEDIYTSDDGRPFNDQG